MISDFYPIQVHQSRYQGSYEGGGWVIIAGLHHPRKNCDAFAGDIPCHNFWRSVGPDGEVKTTEEEKFGEEQETEFYVNSGNDPTELVEEHREWLKDHDEYQTGAQSMKESIEKRDDNEFPALRDDGVDGDS